MNLEKYASCCDGIGGAEKGYYHFFPHIYFKKYS